MTDYGVTPSGFVKKTLSVIQGEINQALRDTISPTLNLLATSVFGQIIGIFSDKVREAWDVSQAVYRAFDPDYATDDALDNVCAITCVTRLAATKSSIVLDRVFLDASTTLPAGSICSVGSTGARFVTIAPVINAAAYPATVTVAAEAQEYGATQALAESIDTIQTPVTGWSDQAALTCANAENYTLNGKTLEVQVDGGSTQTVTFASVDPVTALQAVTEINAQTTDLTATVAGIKIRIASDSGAGSSIQIVGGTGNSALGFSTDLIKGFNNSDATLGTEIETDEELRIRRETLLAASGSSTVDAIRARLFELSSVDQATVFENTSDLTDSNGLPPHSFEALVQGGTETDNWAALTAYVLSDQVANDGNVYSCTGAGTSASSGGPTGTGTGISDGTVTWDYLEIDDEQPVAQTIWDNKPAGIATYGSLSRVVEDSQGDEHTVLFSRPTEVPIYIEVTVLTDPDLYPVDGDAQVQAALVAQAGLQTVGDDVIALVFKSQPLEVAGVIDVTVFLIDDVDPPVSSANVTISSRGLATLLSTDIDVTVTT